MKYGLLIFLMVSINCYGMGDEHNQRTRERDIAFSLEPLEGISEAEKERRFHESGLSFHSYVSYGGETWLPTACLTYVSWIGALWCGAVYADTVDAGNIEPQKSLVKTTVCALCGLALCCTGTVSTIVCCDKCKNLRRNENGQGKLRRIIQLKIGTVKNE